MMKKDMWWSMDGSSVSNQVCVPKGTFLYVFIGAGSLGSQNHPQGNTIFIRNMDVLFIINVATYSS